MADPFVSDSGHIVLCAERNGRELQLGALVYDRAVFAVERAPVDVRLDKVLVDLGANQLEQITHVPEHREVAQDRMLGLVDVVQADEQERHKHNQCPQAGRPNRAQKTDGSKGDEHREKKQVTHIG